jgi:hypothetical protein
MDIFTEWHNGYYLFAGHNCGIYDLTLKLYISKNDVDNHLNMISDERELECEDIDNETKCCKFFLTPSTSKLGLAFNFPSDANWTFDTEWSDCVDNQ